MIFINCVEAEIKTTPRIAYEKCRQKYRSFAYKFPLRKSLLFYVNKKVGVLAAKSFGLDTYLVGFAEFIEKAKDYHKLGIPKDEQIHLAFIVGYGDESPKVHERNKRNAFYK
jgi:gamma-glutamylcysteine synthetase